MKKTTNTARKMAPALSPKDREKQMISLAVNLTEKQLRDGTASPSVITHYLKLGSPKAQLEEEILEKQRDLIVAKTENLRSANRTEELMKQAMEALCGYLGKEDCELPDIFRTDHDSDF